MLNKRKLYILARDEDVFHPALFNTILSTQPDNYTVLGAAIVKNRETLFHSIRHVLRMGGLIDLIKLVRRVIISRLRLMIQGSPLVSVRRIFTYYNVTMEYINSPNDAIFLDSLSHRQPDVILCTVPNILKSRILDLPTLGCVNRHAGRSPNYRGVEPVFQALRKNETHVVITYHKMALKIDSGLVLWEHQEPVREGDTVYTLYQRLFAASDRGFWQAIDNLEKGEGRSVNLNEGVYFSWPTKEQIMEFRRQGRRYI